MVNQSSTTFRDNLIEYQKTPISQCWKNDPVSSYGPGSVPEYNHRFLPYSTYPPNFVKITPQVFLSNLVNKQTKKETNRSGSGNNA